MKDRDGIPPVDPRIIYKPRVPYGDAFGKLGDLISQELPAVVTDILREIGQPIISKNPRLFHYTSGDGLIRILQSGELWMTSVGYLNDRTEYVHGVKLFTASINASIRRETCSLLAQCRRIASELRSFNPNNSFLISFAQNGDQLSQWRGYAADGFGYVLQFDVARLRDALKENPGVLPYSCLFDRKLQRRFCDTYLSRVLGTVPNWLNEAGITVSNEEIALRAGFCIRMVLGMFKHPGFSEENEFRLCLNHLTAGPKELKWSERKGVARPHFPLVFKPGMMPINSIIVGPNVDLGRATWSLNKLLDTKGYKGVTVRKSKIPYLAQG